MHPKHQRTLLKTAIQDAELGYEESAKSIAPGVDQAKQVISANIAALNSRDSKIPNCSLSASGSTPWDSSRKHSLIRTSTPLPCSGSSSRKLSTTSSSPGLIYTPESLAQDPPTFHAQERYDVLFFFCARPLVNSDTWNFFYGIYYVI